MQWIAIIEARGCETTEDWIMRYKNNRHTLKPEFGLFVLQSIIYLQVLLLAAILF